MSRNVALTSYARSFVVQSKGAVYVKSFKKCHKHIVSLARLTCQVLWQFCVCILMHFRDVLMLYILVGAWAGSGRALFLMIHFLKYISNILIFSEYLVCCCDFRRNVHESNAFMILLKYRVSKQWQNKFKLTVLGITSILFPDQSSLLTNTHSQAIPVSDHRNILLLCW